MFRSGRLIDTLPHERTTSSFCYLPAGSSVRAGQAVPAAVRHWTAESAAATQPTRVEYSVTKGGLRSWIVLLVFVFLCSALLTIFSDDGDDHVHPSTPTAKESPLTSEESESEHADAGGTAKPPDREEEITVDATDEDDGPTEEEALFASLREKAAHNEAKRRVTSREPEPPAAEPLHENRRDRRRRLREEAEAEEQKKAAQAEEDEDVDDGDEAYGDEEPEPEEKPKQQEVRKQEPPAQKLARKEEVKPAEEEEDDDDDDEEDEDVPQPTRQPKKHHMKKWQKSIQAQRMAEDQKNPRMGLLKHKKPEKSTLEEHPGVDTDEDDDEDEDNEEGDDENENVQEVSTTVPRVVISDVVSIRKKSGHYNRKAITNRDDRRHATKLDVADYLVEKHDFDSALTTYNQVIKAYRDSPRAHFGRARVYQLKSEFESSESLLDEAISEYQVVLDNEDTPDELFRHATENLIECARFHGNLHKVMTAQRALIDRFPEDISIQNDFGVTFLMMNRPADAKHVFSNILESDPNNALAQAYYGYVLKVYDKEIEKGVHFMRRGLKSSSDVIRDAKFYFHLGDGLMRLGRESEAYNVYEDAVELGLFPSVYQRSMFNLDGLVARPWWTVEQTGCGKHLRHIERQWTVIREESLEAWEKYPSAFEDDDPHMTEGSHKSLYLRRNGEFHNKNCRFMPVACEILKKFSEESSCDKDEIKVSILAAGSRVWPHCAPTNFVLEAQLGLVAPSEARVRVGHDAKGWKTGKFLIFDESFEHEIWFDGAASNSLRVALSIDLWHPQVPAASRTENR